MSNCPFVAAVMSAVSPATVRESSWILFSKAHSTMSVWPMTDRVDHFIVYVHV